jgi:hypothetical protein
MSTKPDVAHAVPSPQCDIDDGNKKKALPLSSEYHRGQLNEYLAETKKPNLGGQSTTESLSMLRKRGK